MRRLRRSCAWALALALLLSSAASAWAQDAAPVSNASRVAAATEAFRDATGTESSEGRVDAFRRAALLYREALAAGPRNGALEYNAGNAWLLSGDVGRAILHYRRALEVRPGDPRVEANLETARGRRRDQFETTFTRALTDTLLFWHRGLSLRSKVPAALTAWVLAFVVLSVGVVLPRRPPGRAGALRSGLLLLIVALALGASAVVDLAARGERTAAVIVESDVELRTGDGASYPARYENPIHAGAEVRVLEERAGWVDIELPDGKSGWVPADMLELV